MTGLSEELTAQFPNMAITPEQLLSYEQLRDVGDAQRAYSRAVSAIKAAN